MIGVAVGNSFRRFDFAGRAARQQFSATHIEIAVAAALGADRVGAALGSVADLKVELDPEIFFLLFLPPLLFIDGWRIPKQGLFRDAATILELALGLVIFTVVGMGFFMHWLIPAMPLAVCFALAAVLSPTDPVAVSAISARVAIPKRMMHILEGESLLNDASGLVCLRFAIAAALTGTFSVWEAFGTFLQLAVGGIAVGFAVTWVSPAQKLGLLSATEKSPAFRFSSAC